MFISVFFLFFVSSKTRANKSNDLNGTVARITDSSAGSAERNIMGRHLFFFFLLYHRIFGNRQFRAARKPDKVNFNSLRKSYRKGGEDSLIFIYI